MCWQDHHSGLCCRYQARRNWLNWALFADVRRRFAFFARGLMAVKSIAVPGAIAQIAVATLLGMALSAVLGWSLMTGIVFGLCFSTASTVVLLHT
ncbi:hypothetical protein ACNKHV_02610 [Shigella flexneri]